MGPSVINCTSQKINHREFFFQKTYAAGTYDDDIINDLVAEIGLPRGNFFEIGVSTTILSKTFSGPAYELLQRFMYDRGMYCYILDGKIYCTMVAVHEVDNIKSLNDYIYTSDPEPVTRNVRNLIEMKAIIETTGRIPDIFKENYKKNRRRRKKKKKKIITYGENDYVEFEAVDQQVDGMVFNLLAAPDINPDDMVSHGGILYRVHKVEHSADNAGGEWDTTVHTDIYNDTGGDFLL